MAAQADTVEREPRGVDNERAACPPGEHTYRHAHGRDGDVARDVPACKRPRRAACQHCPSYVVLPCESSSSLICEPCGVRYRRRVQTVALMGTGVDCATAAAAVDGDEDSLADLARLSHEQGVFSTLVVTVTAGSHISRHRDRSRPDAPWCRCTPVGGVDLGDWNGSQGDRWNRFMQALRRSGLFGEGEHLQYFRAVEVQDGKRRSDGMGRNALHEHVLLRSRGVVRVDADLVDALRELAMDHGYGHEVVVERAAVSQDGRARLAAWYAAKYVSKAADVRSQVPWRRRFLGVKHGRAEVVDPLTGVVSEVATVQERWSPRTYRTWTASRGWGASMAAVKIAQRDWARTVAGVDEPAGSPPPQPLPPGAGECSWPGS